MSDTWSTAYLAALSSPDDTPAFLPPSRTFSGQTVRQAVRLGRGGTAVRLVLSNEFGRVPLVIDEVTVSDPAGQFVVPAPRDGSVRWEIPAGATATSDPVPLPVAAGAELTVSCFVADTIGLATYLHSAQRTGQVAPGNQLREPHLTDAEPFASLYWISRVLVDTPATGPVIIALGDSITRGDATTVDGEQRYPDHLQRRLLAAGLDGAAVLNAGLGGNGLLTGPVRPAMMDRFARDVLGVAEATHVLIMGGLNDIAQRLPYGDRPPSAADLVESLFGLARRARQHAIQPVLGTITPCADSSYESFRTDRVDHLRRAINEALTAQRDWPLVDFAAAVADPDDPRRVAAAYDSGDGVHPGDAGHRALADAVDLTVFKTS
jgi:lysophospholipase L1-like esterase